MTGLRRVEAPTRANAPLISFDEAFKLVKVNPLAAWTDQDMQDYITEHDVLVNPLVYDGYPSIGCAPCTAKPADGADRAAAGGKGWPKPNAGCTPRDGTRADGARQPGSPVGGQCAGGGGPPGSPAAGP
ncbi:hypothetical protein NIIDMKKI_21850 [Mycobacterium kansasii]|uniref:Phosphoadenosine phosphosulphate reductase domain-containing protein n=1 Tax=Mycobacterium kansasii TaxID=1768 RepID=A0A7G1IBR0_MYCKA|nr:hypothetical protein NIIDMKKI_21850 [Mycobacterium kansasii]